MSRSFQNLCHVSCIHFQGLKFYIELETHIRFNCTKFILQIHLLTILQAWLITNDSKFCLVYVLLHESLVDFHQIQYTSNLLCITTTYSKNLEGESWWERWILWVFKNLPIFKPGAKNSIQNPTLDTTPSVCWSTSRVDRSRVTYYGRNTSLSAGSSSFAVEFNFASLNGFDFASSVFSSGVSLGHQKTTDH